MLVDRRSRLGAVVAGAGLLGLLLSGCGDGPSAPGGADGVVVKTRYADMDGLPERLEPNGTTITVGDLSAPTAVHLYEDPRCPVCEEFELTGGGPELRAMTLRREVRTEYTLASFLDDRQGGCGSKKAVNALRAALEQGKFAEYHAVLYENQPEEQVDGYTDEFLLKLAGKVKGLRSPAFDSAVKTMKYDSFVAASQRAYESDGAPGTPTMAVNGFRVPQNDSGALFDKELFVKLMKYGQYGPTS